MKKIQLLSIIFSLIIISGISAGSSVFAESDEKHENLIRRLDNFCMLNDSAKEQFFLDYPRITQFKERITNICDLSEDERKITLEEFLKENFSDRKHNYNIVYKLEQFCTMSDTDKEIFLSEHDIEQKDVMNAYCDLDESGRSAYIAEHKMLVDEMQKKHKEISKHKAEYQKFCEMTPEQRTAEITDAEKFMKISEWCEMTPDQRDQYKKEHYDIAMNFKEKHHDALDRMKEKQNLSHRLREMIMTNATISQEELDELKAKYQERYGKLSDEKKAEIKMKFHEHISSMLGKLSDEQKTDIKARYADMKALKTELREKSSILTNEEKQELRAEFIEKAKSIQLAWISPRLQVAAGIDAGEIECREGFSLVIKTSNGLPMCLKADSAIRMIENGFAVPAN